MEHCTDKDYDYAVYARRHIHEYPETGFDLDRTVAFVRQELDKLGIAWTDRYGKGSVAAWIGPADARAALGIRADMDALPVTEKTGLPYASKIPGKMHACGHDAHTAVLLTVARILKRMEDRLPCRVKLLFQPSEECEVSGAQAMMELGAVDDVDAVIGAHCDNTLETGLIGVRAGDYMAACDPFTVTFLGKTAHATQPEQGVDAIAMAWEAYGQLKELARSEAGDDTVYIFSIGCFQGGTAHNVIADQCLLKISFRYYDMEFAKRVQEKTMALCRHLAERRGGSVEFDWPTSTLAVYNDPALAAQFVQSTGRILPGRVVEIPLRKSSEDFSWFMTRKPGLLFRFGTRNETLGCTTMAHCNDFLLDEAGMRSAIDAFVQFVLDW